MISEFDLGLLKEVEGNDLIDKTVEETPVKQRLYYWYGQIHFLQEDNKKIDIVLNNETDKASIIIRDLENNKLVIIGSYGQFIISKSKSQTVKIEWKDKEKTSIEYTTTNIPFSEILNSFVFITTGKEDEIGVLKLYLHYGVRPARVAAYLNGTVNPWDKYSPEKETEALETFITISKRVSLPPWYIAAVIFQEGFAENFPESAIKGNISSFYDIGAEAFISEIEELKEKGYLRQNFNEGTDYIVSKKIINEANDEFISAVFIDIPRAIEAVGALLANRRDRFLSFMKKEYGFEEKNLTEKEILAGTYIFYNVRNPKKFTRWLINKHGISGLNTPYHGYQIDTKRPIIRYGTINCARVIGTSEILKEKWQDLIDGIN